MFILFEFNLPVTCAKESPEFEMSARLEGGLVLGGQIINDGLIYLSGSNLMYTNSIKTSGNSFLGLGAGFYNFRNETFIPFVFDFFGFTGKSKNKPFLNFQAGYSLGFSDLYKNYSDYNFKGGLCFSAGLGKCFAISNRFSALISISYRHQFAHVRYTYSGVSEIESDLNYDMLLFTFGIMICQD